jgi:hypothetical protein
MSFKSRWIYFKGSSVTAAEKVGKSYGRQAVALRPTGMNVPPTTVRAVVVVIVVVVVGWLI